MDEAAIPQNAFHSQLVLDEAVHVAAEDHPIRGPVVQLRMDGREMLSEGGDESLVRASNQCQRLVLRHRVEDIGKQRMQLPQTQVRIVDLAAKIGAETAVPELLSVVMIWLQRVSKAGARTFGDMDKDEAIAVRNYHVVCFAMLGCLPPSSCFLEEVDPVGDHMLPVE
jgi:hypothetical protein